MGQVNHVGPIGSPFSTVGSITNRGSYVTDLGNVVSHAWIEPTAR